MLLVFLVTADCAGLLILTNSGTPPLDIESHQVNITLNNGIAVTQVTQGFRNNENRQLEEFTPSRCRLMPV
jgi:hypothetical protein